MVYTVPIDSCKNKLPINNQSSGDSSLFHVLFHCPLLLCLSLRPVFVWSQLSLAVLLIFIQESDIVIILSSLLCIRIDSLLTLLALSFSLAESSFSAVTFVLKCCRTKQFGWSYHTIWQSFGCPCSPQYKKLQIVAI